jgi:hypothetical protein
MIAFKYALVFVWVPVFIQAATVRGVVLDPGGMPLPTAQIRVLRWPTGLEEAKTMSNRDGEYKVEVPTGTYAVESCVPGFLCATYHPVHVNSLDVATFEFRLPLGPVIGDTFGAQFTVNGRVRTKGRPAERYDVCFATAQGKSPVCFRTGHFGTYKGSLSPASYNVTLVSPAGKILWSKSVDIHESTRLDIDARER